MTQPKILLYCPVSNYKDYIIWEWLNHIKKITFAPLDILLIDNSDNAIYAQRIAAEGFNCIHVHSHSKETVQARMHKCYVVFREYFLKNNYHFWFSLECDIFPPVNIIEYFLSHKKTIIGAPYFTRLFGYDSLLTSSTEYEGDHIRDNSDTFFQDFARINGKLITSPNPGLGCFLIHRSVIKKVEFKQDYKRTNFTDSRFWEDVWNNQFDIYLDTSLNVKHYNNSWKEIHKNEANKGIRRN